MKIEVKSTLAFASDCLQRISSFRRALNGWERGQYMKQTFTKLCNYGYQILPLYAGLREILTTQGNGTRTLFEETFHRIKNGKYRQVSERELCLETKILRFEYMMVFFLLDVGLVIERLTQKAIE